MVVKGPFQKVVSFLTEQTLLSLLVACEIPGDKSEVDKNEQYVHLSLSILRLFLVNIDGAAVALRYFAINLAYVS